MKTILVFVLVTTFFYDTTVAQTDTITVGVPVRLGWNLLSNPVYRVTGTDSICQVYPGVSPCCYPLVGSGGYGCDYRMHSGQGYWLKVLPGFPTVDSVVYITGEPIARDSVLVASGWNLIGSISYPVATNSVTSIPTGIIRSGFYYHRSGYLVADTIHPGWGYWVKVSQPGSIVLSSTGQR